MVLCLTSDVVLPKIWVWLIDWGRHHQLSPLQPFWMNVASDNFAENSFSDRKIAVMMMLACMMKQLIGWHSMPPSLSGTLRTKFSPLIAFMDKNVMKCRASSSWQADGHILVWIAGIKHSIPSPTTSCPGSTANWFGCPLLPSYSEFIFLFLSVEPDCTKDIRIGTCISDCSHCCFNNHICLLSILSWAMVMRTLHGDVQSIWAAIYISVLAV